MGLNLALAAGVAVLLLRGGAADGPGGSDVSRLHADPDLRAEVMRELADAAFGVHDSHVDPQVGRVLFAGVERTSPRGEELSSNLFGMRERAYELPKPEGVLRIVLLGDSLVYGIKVEADERVGAYLERELRAADSTRAVEVLHLGIASWNVWNECAFVRRQVGLLRPDLVVHVLTDNDLDDGLGVRGFGAMATFSPAARHRGDARISRTQLVPEAQRTFSNPLLLGQDEESRMRRREAYAAVDALVEALGSVGASYVPLVYSTQDAVAVVDAIVPPVWRENTLVVESSFARDAENWVSATDAHWGPVGAERLAGALFDWLSVAGALEADGPNGVVPKADADALAGTRFGDVLRFADATAPDVEAFADLDDVFRASGITTGEARHVYAGFQKGRIGRVATFVLRPPANADLRVHVKGRVPDRPELTDVTLAVTVEGLHVGTLELEPGATVDAALDVPELEALPGRFARVELEASDHALTGGFLQELVSFELEELRLSAR